MTHRRQVPALNSVFREAVLTLAASQSVPKEMVIEDLPSGKAISMRIQFCQWRKKFLDFFADPENGKINITAADEALRRDLAPSFTVGMLEMISLQLIPPATTPSELRHLRIVSYPIPRMSHVAADGTLVEPDFSKIGEMPLEAQLRVGGRMVPIADPRLEREKGARALRELTRQKSIFEDKFLRDGTSMVYANNPGLRAAEAARRAEEASFCEAKEQAPPPDVVTALGMTPTDIYGTLEIVDSSGAVPGPDATEEEIAAYRKRQGLTGEGQAAWDRRALRARALREQAAAEAAERLERNQRLETDNYLPSERGK